MSAPVAPVAPLVRVLVTAGATREPIDRVRYLTNMSSGQTGAQIASELSRSGCEVVFLHGMGARMPVGTPEGPIETLSFLSFEDLVERTRKLLASVSFDFCIHSAAVSDFRVDQIQFGGKIHSPQELGKMDSHDEVQLVLKKNFKLVNLIKRYSRNADIQLMAFKLTYDASMEARKRAVRDLARRSHADWVVHNDLLQIETSREHRFSINYCAGGKTLELVKVCRGKADLAQAIAKIVNPESQPEVKNDLNA